MRLKTYKEWVANVQCQIDQPSCKWSRVGIWGFPAKGNTRFNDIMIHYCHKYYLQCINDRIDRNRTFDKCAACGMASPDGIKMIALLEKL